MNKTIIININSIVFHIEEDAYETLRAYMIDIKKHFSQTQTEDSGEILLDIENRIAEMFSERIQQGKKEVISLADVEEVIRQMGRVSDFEELEDPVEEQSKAFKPKEEPRQSLNFSDKKLMRNPDDMVLGGVCSGLGYYLGIQAKWVRIFFVLFFLLGGSGVLLYIVLWAVMPLASTRSDRMAMRGETPNLQNFKKNFEEESDRQEFSNIKSTFSKGAQTVGNGVSGFFRVLGKLFATFTLFISGSTIFGMFCLLCFGLLGVLGFHQEVLPPLEFLSTGNALIAFLAGIFAITIPFIALFYISLRVLFKISPMNNYLSLSLWAGWIVSILAVIFYAAITNQDMNESSTIKVEKKLEKYEAYYFAEKDLRVIEASDEGQKKFDMKFNGKSFSDYLYADIDIDFQQIDSLEQPYIQYNYSARGRNRQRAAELASQIDYSAHQDKNKVFFDSHFALTSPSLKRDQHVSVIVYLPQGSHVVIAESLRYKLHGVSYRSCDDNNEEKVGQTEWIMTKSGLKCSSKVEEDTSEEEI